MTPQLTIRCDTCHESHTVNTQPDTIGTDAAALADWWDGHTCAYRTEVGGVHPLVSGTTHPVRDLHERDRRKQALDEMIRLAEDGGLYDTETDQ